jgi:hypothetical protein
MGLTGPYKKQFASLHKRGDQFPGVHQEERTKIRKGVIVKEKVWFDDKGNELEKLTDDPVTFQVITKQTKPAPVIKGYPDLVPDYQTIPIEIQFIPKKSSELMVRHQTANRTDWEIDENLGAALLMVGSATLLCMLWFFAGYFLGRKVKENIMATAKTTDLTTTSHPYDEQPKSTLTGNESLPVVETPLSQPVGVVVA